MSWIAALPTLNASLNFTSAVLLGLGYTLVRRQRITAHRVVMGSACVVSALFLVSYAVYHFQTGHTKFTGTGMIRPVYLFILMTHIVLAIAIVPLVLVTLRRALTGRFAQHRAIARWTLPLWFYVSATGVVIYFMLYCWFPRP